MRLRPVSILRCTRAGRPARRAPSSTAARCARDAADRSIPAATAGAKSSSGRCSHDSTGAVDPRAAQRERLVEGADAQPGGPGVERGPGDRDGPVPVPVGLDHGHERGARSGGGEHAGRCAGPRRGRPPPRPGPQRRGTATSGVGHTPILPSAPRRAVPPRESSVRPAPSSPWSSTTPVTAGGADRSDRRRDRPLDRRRRDRRAVGRELRGPGVHERPAPRRPPRLQPRGQQRADDPGQHVAGARRGRPRRRRRVHERPAVRVGDDRGVALEQHRHLQRPPRPAGRPRSGPHPTSPATRANSRSCGVITTGRPGDRAAQIRVPAEQRHTVGVDAHRDVTVQHGREQRPAGVVGPDPGPDRPRLGAPGRRRCRRWR